MKTGETGRGSRGWKGGGGEHELQYLQTPVIPVYCRVEDAAR